MKHLQIGLMGTKKKYAEEILTNGIKNPNSAIFFIEPKDLFKRLDITIQIAIYHAISISTQEKIRNQSHRDFADYYLANPEDLPCLILVKRIGDLPQSMNSYQLDSDITITFPYTKINIVGEMEIQNIVSMVPIELESIIKATHHINFPNLEFEKYGDTFFTKTGDRKNIIDFSEKILPPEIMRNITENLQLGVYNQIVELVSKLYDM